MKLNFNQIDVKKSANSSKELISVHENLASKRKDSGHVSTKNIKKKKVSRTRKKNKDNIISDVILGKPCRPFGLVYNIYKPHPDIVDYLPDMDSRPDNLKVFIGMGFLYDKSPQYVFSYLKKYSPIVTEKTKIYIDYILRKFINPVTKKDTEVTKTIFQISMI